MRFELREPRDLGPYDHMIAAGPGTQVVIAVPEHEHDAIANLQAAGLTVEVLDDTSHVG